MTDKVYIRIKSYVYNKQAYNHKVLHKELQTCIKSNKGPTWITFLNIVPTIIKIWIQV